MFPRFWRLALRGWRRRRRPKIETEVSIEHSLGFHKHSRHPAICSACRKEMQTGAPSSSAKDTETTGEERSG